MLGGMEIAVIVGAAVLLFGADKVPKLARGMGQAKKEFLVGQAEADVEAERLRTEARASAEARVHANAAVVPENVTVPSSPSVVAAPPMHDATAPLPPQPPQSASPL